MKVGNLIDKTLRPKCSILTSASLLDKPSEFKYSFGFNLDGNATGRTTPFFLPSPTIKSSSSSTSSILLFSFVPVKSSPRSESSISDGLNTSNFCL